MLLFRQFPPFVASAVAVAFGVGVAGSVASQHPPPIAVAQRLVVALAAAEAQAAQPAATETSLQPQSQPQSQSQSQPQQQPEPQSHAAAAAPAIAGAGSDCECAQIPQPNAAAATTATVASERNKTTDIAAQWFGRPPARAHLPDRALHRTPHCIGSTDRFDLSRSCAGSDRDRDFGAPSFGGGNDRFDDFGGGFRGRGGSGFRGRGRGRGGFGGDMNCRECGRAGHKAMDCPDKKAKLFVGNLPFDVVPKQVITAFDGCDGFIDIALALDEGTGRCRGYGHALFSRDDQMSRAASRMNGVKICGKEIRCDANPKARAGGDRGGRGGGFRGRGGGRGGYGGGFGGGGGW